MSESSTTQAATEPTEPTTAPTTEPVKATRPRNDWQTFIDTYNASTTAAQVASKLGIKITSVQARASTLRGKGVPLKKMERINNGRTKTADISKIKAYVEEQNAKMEASTQQ